MRKTIALLVLSLCVPAFAQTTLATLAGGTLTLQNPVPSVTVPPCFTGFAVEWGSAQSLFASGSTVDAIFTTLQSNLEQYAGVPCNPIRIGGNTSNQSTSTQNVAALAALYNNNGTTFDSLGVNQLCGSTAIPATQAASYFANMPAGSFSTIEVGNEPDSADPTAATGTTYNGCSTHVMGFTNWNFQTYLTSLQAIIAAVQAKPGMSAQQFAGPTFALYNGINAGQTLTASYNSSAATFTNNTGAAITCPTGSPIAGTSIQVGTVVTGTGQAANGATCAISNTPTGTGTMVPVTIGGFSPSKPGIVTLEAGTISEFAQHYYAGSAAGAGVPTDFLMYAGTATPPFAVGLNSYYGQFNFRSDIKAAHAFNQSFILDETNTVANGGQTGVSDSHQAALYAILFSFQMASEGADGLRWQGTWDNSNHYSPGYITVSGTTFTLHYVNPLFYGMQFFQQATAGTSSQIYPLTITAGTSPAIQAWETINAANQQRVVMVSLDETHGGATAYVVVPAPPGVTDASACYLYNTGSTAYSSGPTTEVIFGNLSGSSGQTYNGSSTGALTGSASYTHLMVTAAGTFLVPMEPNGEAAILLLNATTGC